MKSLKAIVIAEAVLHGATMAPTVFAGKVLLAARMVLVGMALSACIALVGCGGGGSSPVLGHIKISPQDFCRTECHDTYKHGHDKESAIADCIEEKVKEEVNILDKYLEDVDTIKKDADKILIRSQELDQLDSDDTDIMLSDTVVSDADAIIQYLTKLRTIMKGQVTFHTMSEQSNKNFQGAVEGAMEKLPYMIKYLDLIDSEELIYPESNKVEINHNLSGFIREDIDKTKKRFREIVEQIEHLEECGANRSVFHGTPLSVPTKTTSLSYMSSLAT